MTITLNGTTGITSPTEIIATSVTVPTISVQTINAGTGNTLSLQTNNVTAVTIDTNQNVGIGYTSITTGTGFINNSLQVAGQISIGSNAPRAVNNTTRALTIEGTGANTTGISAIRNTVDSNPFYFNFVKTRGTVLGGNDAVISGDTLGIIYWNGADGTTSTTSIGKVGASLQVLVTGAVSAGIVPSAFVFSTTDVTGATTERARIDSSGNLGLGVTPSAWNSGYRFMQFFDATSAFVGGSGYALQVGANAYVNSSSQWIYGGGSYGSSRYTQFNGAHLWFTAPSGTAGTAITFTQAMTLDASGNLLINTTDVDAGIGGNVSNTQFSFRASSEGFRMSSTGSAYYNVGNAATTQYVFFRYAGSTVGNIAITSTVTAYNTSSDYRLKNSIAPMTGALARVAALKPVTYKWNADGSDAEGFIAHELAEVCPHAVTGEKDAVDAEGNPVYQGIDTSFLVATLTAAIQELSAQVTTLQAQVTALQANVS